MESIEARLTACERALVRLAGDPAPEAGEACSEAQPGADAGTMVHLASMLGETEGLALGWLSRLGGAVQRLVSAHEAAGWTRQQAWTQAIVAIEDMVAEVLHDMERRAAAQRALERGADLVFTVSD